MTEQAKENAKRYVKEWRRKHPEKVKEYNKRYSSKLKAAAGASRDKEP